jgi:hypothetical protein
MFLGSRALPVHRADNLATFCEPIVQCGILNISQLTTLYASTACYGDSFTFFFV